MICHYNRARMYGSKVCLRLKKSIPRHLFHIQVQGAVGGKIVAREDITAMKKDVTAKCVSEPMCSFVFPITTKLPFTGTLDIYSIDSVIEQPYCI